MIGEEKLLFFFSFPMKFFLGGEGGEDQITPLSFFIYCATAGVPAYTVVSLAAFQFAFTRIFPLSSIRLGSGHLPTL